MPEWFSLIAFGTAGEVLARHVKSDMVAVSGKLTKSAWTGKDGAERSGFSVLVDTIASARTVRPGKPKAKREHAEELNDEISVLCVTPTVRPARYGGIPPSTRARAEQCGGG